HQARADEERTAHADTVDPAAAHQREQRGHQRVDREQRPDDERRGTRVDGGKREADPDATEADVRQDGEDRQLENLQGSRPSTQVRTDSSAPATAAGWCPPAMAKSGLPPPLP